MCIRDRPRSADDSHSGGDLASGQSLRARTGRRCRPGCRSRHRLLSTGLFIYRLALGLWLAPTFLLFPGPSLPLLTEQYTLLSSWGAWRWPPTENPPREPPPTQCPLTRSPSTQCPPTQCPPVLLLSGPSRPSLRLWDPSSPAATAEMTQPSCFPRLPGGSGSVLQARPWQPNGQLSPTSTNAMATAR